MLFGGGDILCTERLRDRSTCAFFECDSARVGIAGVSKVGISVDAWEPPVDAGPLSKKGLSSSVGVMGDDPMNELSAEVAGVLRQLRSAAKSESPAELIDEPEEAVEEPET